MGGCTWWLFDRTVLCGAAHSCHPVLEVSVRWQTLRARDTEKIIFVEGDHTEEVNKYTRSQRTERYTKLLFFLILENVLLNGEVGDACLHRKEHEFSAIPHYYPKIRALSIIPPLLSCSLSFSWASSLCYSLQIFKFSKQLLNCLETGRH